MEKEHPIIAQVYAAKENMAKADALIEAYLPFIRKEASKFMGRVCTPQDDEQSIAMIAFHEAVQGYSRERGAFLNYAALLIRSRLIDHRRKEARHQGQISLHAQPAEDDRPLHETLVDPASHSHLNAEALEATRQEIEELRTVLENFGVTFTDIAENSPRQERTLEACRRAVHHAMENHSLLEELLRTKKLPLSALAAGAGVERKTLERHRRYLLAMLLIQTNGYEIIRGHIRHVLKGKGGTPV